MQHEKQNDADNGFVSENTVTLETVIANPDIWKQIPGYSNYYINDKCELYSSTTNRLLAGSITGSGYLSFSLRTDNREHKVEGMHRLMALAFITDERDRSQLVVNHINGNRLDNRIENLEWCTVLENIYHAGKYLKSPKCIPVAVRWMDSGTVTEFPTLLAAAKYLGVSKDTLLYRVTKYDKDTIYPGGYQIRKLREDDWNILNGAEEAINTSSGKAVLLRNVVTGEVTVYDKQSDLAEDNDICVATVSKWVRLPGQPVLPGLFQMQRKSEFTDWRIPEDPYQEVGEARGIPMVVYYNGDGSWFLYERQIDLCRHVGIKPSYLTWLLKERNNEPLTKTGEIFANYNVCVHRGRNFTVVSLLTAGTP